MQIDHCAFWKSDYNAGRNQKGSVRQMSTTKKRSILQILKDLFEDEAIAFAMCYASRRGDMDFIRSMEKKVSE